MLISFIMPVKNASQFIQEAIDGVKKQTQKCWELIIIEDHSDDNTFDIAKDSSEKDSRIKVLKNIGKGKVVGLNYGYSFAKGNIIKCIDGDDVLHEKFIDYCLEQPFDAMCHDSYITDSNMDIITQNSVSKRYKNASFDYCFKYFQGLARWTWTFNRDIADKIFPMPENLTYEDLWFSLVIKRNASNVLYIKTPLYYYRQHDNQTYGGIYNYSKEIVIFRAKRKLKYISILENNYQMFYDSKEKLRGSLSLINQYLLLMSKEKISYRKIFFNKFPLFMKIKLLGFKKMPKLVSTIKRITTLKY